MSTGSDTSACTYEGLFFPSLHAHPLVDNLFNGPLFHKFGASFKWFLAVPEKAKDQGYMFIRSIKPLNPLHFSIHHLKGVCVYMCVCVCVFVHMQELFQCLV